GKAIKDRSQSLLSRLDLQEIISAFAKKFQLLRRQARQLLCKTGGSSLAGRGGILRKGGNERAATHQGKLRGDRGHGSPHKKRPGFLVCWLHSCFPSLLDDDEAAHGVVTCAAGPANLAKIMNPL